MDTFLTIKQAVDITGKSVSTIRRVITELKKSDQKDEYLSREQGITGDRWLIKKDYLFKKLRLNNGYLKDISNEQVDTIDILKDEIQFLRSQIVLERKEKEDIIQIWGFLHT